MTDGLAFLQAEMPRLGQQASRPRKAISIVPAFPRSAIVRLL